MTLGLRNFRNARSIGLSEDQKRHELRAQLRFFAAVAEMRAAIKDINESSIVVKMDPSAFDGFVKDERPTMEYWAEKLAARHE